MMFPLNHTLESWLLKLEDHVTSRVYSKWRHTPFNLDGMNWREFRGVAEGIFVKDISTKSFSEHFNTSLFIVEPSGELPRHQHSHAHVIYFLSGEGELWVGAETQEVKPRLVTLISSEEKHGYKNTGKTDMMLVVINTPATR